MNPSLSYLATLAEHGVDKSHSDSTDSAFQQRKFLWKLVVSSSCFARCSSFKWDLYDVGSVLGADGADEPLFQIKLEKKLRMQMLKLLKRSKSFPKLTKSCSSSSGGRASWIKGLKTHLYLWWVRTLAAAKRGLEKVNPSRIICGAKHGNKCEVCQFVA